LLDRNQKQQQGKDPLRQNQPAAIWGVHAGRRVAMGEQAISNHFAPPSRGRDARIRTRQSIAGRLRLSGHRVSKKVLNAQIGLACGRRAGRAQLFRPVAGHFSACSRERYD
jgi:hypothetical protein